MVTALGGTHARGQMHTVATGKGSPVNTTWHESFELVWDGMDALVLSIWLRRLDAASVRDKKRKPVVLEDECVGTAAISLLSLDAGAPRRYEAELRRIPYDSDDGREPPEADVEMQATGAVLAEVCYWTRAPSAYVPPQRPRPGPSDADYVVLQPTQAVSDRQAELIDSLESLF